MTRVALRLFGREVLAVTFDRGEPQGGSGYESSHLSWSTESTWQPTGFTPPEFGSCIPAASHLTSRRSA